MLLKDFLVNKTIKHHKIPSKNNEGKIQTCEFRYFNSDEIFDAEVHLELKIKYFDKNGKIKNKRIEEDINYLEFIE